MDGPLASDALRGGPEHTGAFGAMVLAQALGDEDRQVSRHEKSDCRAGATAGRNHAPHLWTGRALQGNSNGMVILVRANLSGLTWELVLRAIIVVRTSFVG